MTNMSKIFKNTSECLVYSPFKLLGSLCALHSWITAEITKVLIGCELIWYLLNEEGKQYSVQELQEKYGLSIMEINSLSCVISKKVWAQLKHHPSSHKEPSQYEQIITRKNVSAWYYRKRYEDKENGLLFSGYTKWQSILHSPLSFQDYKACFVNLKKITNHTKYRSFQFRMLHNAIILNDKLCRWKVLQENKCSFGCDEPETEMHFFVECPVSQ